jgi:hypothetical protein
MDSVSADAVTDRVHDPASGRAGRGPRRGAVGAPARRVLAVLFTAAALGTITAIAAEGASHAAAPFRLSAPVAPDPRAPRDLAVNIVNTAANAQWVLPNLIRLRAEGAGAQYVPYPGPAIDPWGGARELAPGESATVLFRDASDRRGVWRLPPGSYRIRAIYDVPENLAVAPFVSDAGRVWRGRSESPAAAMSVR